MRVVFLSCVFVVIESIHDLSLDVDEIEVATGVQ